MRVQGILETKSIRNNPCTNRVLILSEISGVLYEISGVYMKYVQQLYPGS